MVDNPRIPPFDQFLVRPWAGERIAWWAPAAVLTGCWLLALFVSIAFDPARCSATNPALCGPDLPFSAALTAFFAAPVLLWWMPRLGCAFGIGFGLLDALLDDAPQARIAWTGFAVACLAGLEVLMERARRQRRLGEPDPVPGLPSGSTGVTGRIPEGRVRISWRTPAAVVLVAGAIGVFGVYAHLTSVEEQHRATAQSTVAQVTAVNTEDATITIDGAGFPPRTIGLLDLSPVVGDTVPVLIDPGSDWVRLVAEPDDQTYWVTIGLLALLLALLLSHREAAGLRWPGRVTGRDLPARRVTVRSDGALAYLYPADADAHSEPFAVMSIASDRARSSPLPDPIPLEPGVVLGDLVTGNWVAIVVRDELLWPRGPLGVARQNPTWWIGGRAREPTTNWSPAVEGINGTRPSSPRTSESWSPDPRSWTFRTARPTQVFGWFLIAAGGATAVLDKPFIAAGRDTSWSAVLGGFIFGTALVFNGWGKVSQRLIVEPDAVVVVGTWRRYRVPWAELRQVGLDDRHVLLTWDQQQSFPVGPFPAVLEARAALTERKDRASRTEKAERPTQRWRRSSVALLAALVILLPVTLTIGDRWGMEAW